MLTTNTKNDENLNLSMLTSKKVIESYDALLLVNKMKTKFNYIAIILQIIIL